MPEAREFVAALRDVSKDTVVYSEIPHAQHAFDFFGSPRGYYTAQAVEKFLSWVHASRETRSQLLRHRLLDRPSAPRKALRRGGFR